METLHAMFQKGKDAGIETRGISDHGFIHSIYFRDPNGYVIELTAKTETRDAEEWQRVKSKRASAVLDKWTATKPADAA